MSSLKFLQLVLLALLVCLAGCGGEPYTYTQENELKPGPGIFSGEEGEFQLIKSSREKEGEEKQKPPKD